MDVNKYLVEGEENVIYEADNLEQKQVADIFTRYIMGDRKAAIAQLTKMKDKGSISGYATSTSHEDYNKQYSDLYKKILQAIK